MILKKLGLFTLLSQRDSDCKVINDDGICYKKQIRQKISAIEMEKYQ